MANKEWNPADLLQLSGGYWSACALHAGVELDLFSLLAAEALTAAAVADKAGTDRRATAMLLEALAVMELLEKSGETYRATASAATFLSRDSSRYLGHIIRHHHHLMAGWSRLDQAVKSGAPVQPRPSHEAGEEQRESFLLGMFDLAMLLAPRIVPQLGLQGRKRLLDLGGGPGTYAIHCCLHYPELRAVVYDLPSTRPFAEATIERFGLGDRIAFAAGDFLDDALPGPFDVAWLSHILHGDGPDECAVILEKAIGALEPGGVILVQEFILGDRTSPLFPALFSLNMLVNTPAGRSYSEEELCRMLVAAGAVEPHRLAVELPNGAGIIAATIPGKG